VTHVLHRHLMMFSDVMISRFFNEVMGKVFIKQVLTIKSQQK